MMLASRLGMSVDRCQKETPARRFWKWLRFIREKQEQPDWMDYYLARIAYEVHCLRGCWVKGFKPAKLEDFLVRRPVVPVKRSANTKEERVKEAKAYWGAFFAAHNAVQKDVSGKRKGK